ncbi:MAG: hypothetical protein ACTSU5_12655, partial [Promethearchaeota archaeon]
KICSKSIRDAISKKDFKNLEGIIYQDLRSFMEQDQDRPPVWVDRLQYNEEFTTSFTTQYAQLMRLQYSAVNEPPEDPALAEKLGVFDPLAPDPVFPVPREGVFRVELLNQKSLVTMEGGSCKVPVEFQVKTVKRKLYFECTVKIGVKDKNEKEFAHILIPRDYFFLREGNDYTETRAYEIPVELPSSQTSVIFFTLQFYTFERDPSELVRVDSILARVSKADK